MIGTFPRFMDQELNEMLGAPVTLEELEKTLGGFKKSRSLGPDGWSIEIFIEFCKLIMGEDLLKVVEEQAHTTGRITSALNATFIALIPKRSDPKAFNDFSLISLCNVLFKIICPNHCKSFKIMSFR